MSQVNGQPMSDRLIESYAFLEALYQRPIRPVREVGLSRSEWLMNGLTGPHEAYPSVHITGSCGKGSTTTMMGSMLSAQGYKVGLFRSPHFDDYRERIVIGAEAISEPDWLRWFEAVREPASQLEQTEFGRPSLFEFLWAMAAAHFAEEGVDIAVVEVGMGGRLDATNVLNPEVSVVTTVSLEHTAILGPTEEAIATEKAAIIKSGSHAVTAVDHRGALKVIQDRCRQVGAPLWRVGEEIGVEDGFHSLGIKTPLREHRDIRLSLAGSYQVGNAAVAIGAIDALVVRGHAVSADAVRAGLASARLPGRFEIFAGNPVVVLDGARNRASAAALRQSVTSSFAGKKVHLVIGVLDDKDAGGVADELAPLVESVSVAPPPYAQRTVRLGRLVQEFRRLGKTVSEFGSAGEAMERAMNVAGVEDVVLVTGSLYLVAEARRSLIRASGKTLTATTRIGA
jgi:dihydrofolate synthase/folylpolyglutamate synthase